MRIASRIALIGAALILLFASRSGRGEQFQDFGDFRVYYAALTTDLLLPEVAKTYGIARSPHGGFLNIAVQKGKSDGLGDAVPASITGTAKTLTGSETPVRFREIAEDGSVYYIGEFPVASRDTYRFTLDVTPKGAAAPYKLVFSKDYIVD